MLSKMFEALKFDYVLQNQTDHDRLEQLLQEIARHNGPIETDQPDTEWLEGTGADKHKKVTMVFFLSIWTDRFEHAV